MGWKELILTVSTLCGCDGLKITESTDLLLPGNECLNDTGIYIYEYYNAGYGGFERTAF